MRYELPNFRVDFRDWMKGNNLYDDYPTGGLKAAQVGYNPFKYPGLLVSNQNLSEASVSSGLYQSPAITWAARFVSAASGSVPVLLGVDSDPYVGSTPKVYWMDQTTKALTAFTTTTAFTATYRKGFSYMVKYGSGLLVSSTNNLTKLTLGSPNITKDEDYRTTAGLSGMSSTSPHPIAFLDNLAYVADNEDIHELDPATNTGVDSVFSLQDTYTITELTEHRGYLYIAATEEYSYSTTPNTFINSRDYTRIFVWDGFSQGYLDNYTIPDRVTAMYSGDDGRLYIWTIKQFGYLNGIEFKPLRDIENVVYRDDIVPVKNGLMYADGTKLITYASVMPNATRRFFIQEIYTKNITSVITIGNEQQIVLKGGSSLNGIVVSYGSYLTQSGGSRTFEFNARFTKVSVAVRHVIVETEGLGASGVIVVAYKDSKGNTNTCGTYTYADTAMAATRRWVFDVFEVDPTSQITPIITITGTAKLKSVDYYYEEVVEVNNA